MAKFAYLIGYDGEIPAKHKRYANLAFYPKNLK